MNRYKIFSRFKSFCQITIFVMLAGFPFITSGQNSLETFLDSALVHNPDAVSINTQIQSFWFDDQMIAAILRSPKAFVSSEVLVTPYLNNNGKLIDIAPSDKAIGYDINISN